MLFGLYYYDLRWPAGAKLSVSYFIHKSGSNSPTGGEEGMRSLKGLKTLNSCLHDSRRLLRLRRFGVKSSRGIERLFDLSGTRTPQKSIKTVHQIEFRIAHPSIALLRPIRLEQKPISRFVCGLIEKIQATKA